MEVHLNLSRYKSNNVLQWDVLSYYSYLPATFIDKDVTLKFVNTENNVREKGVKYWYLEDHKGNRVLKYTMGMSVLYSPFFFIAHTLASPFGFKPDGFSDIYEFFIEFSGLFYLLIGLWYLRKLLLQFYDEKITAISLIILFFGTNLLCYSTVDPAMTHAYTFSLFSVFLYFVYDFYKKYNFKSVILLAICYGLIVLVRPINILLIIPLLLYNVNNFNAFKIRLNFFISHYKYTLCFIIIVGLILLPQFIYYKYVTGNYFVFSYGKEGFFFNHFHLFDVLLSFRKGWFIYTPVILFAFFGIWNIRKERVSAFSWMIFILLPLYIYIVSSWWCWWYGGSFSQRSMIDIYPLLAIPLAAFLFKIQYYGMAKQKFLNLLFVICVLLNIFQTIQYKYNIIDFDGMTSKEYIHVFGSLDDKKIDTTLLAKPNYELAVMGLSE